MQTRNADCEVLLNSLRLCAVLAIATAFVIGASADPNSPSDIIKARQASMKVIAEAGKTIAGMFDGKLPFDASAFKQSAETIRRHSGDALIMEFPATTLGPPSAAKPEIDRARGEFDASARKVAAFASVISAAADNAPNGITPGMRMGSSSSMGSSLLGKRKVSAGEEDITKLPAEHALHLMLQECSSWPRKVQGKSPIGGSFRCGPCTTGGKPIMFLQPMDYIFVVWFVLADKGPRPHEEFSQTALEVGYRQHHSLRGRRCHWHHHHRHHHHRADQSSDVGRHHYRVYCRLAVGLSFPQAIDAENRCKGSVKRYLVTHS